MTTHAQRVQPQGYQPSATQKQKKNTPLLAAANCTRHDPMTHFVPSEKERNLQQGAKQKPAEKQKPPTTNARKSPRKTRPQLA